MGRERMLIAMSGGVDSSVTALLLQQQGFDCAGVTLRLYRNSDIGLSPYRTCCSEESIQDAADVAFQLGIPFTVADYTEAFAQEVIDPFTASYQAGETPNPCIECNRRIKFTRLLDEARERGFDHLATGHYARIAFDEEHNRWLLKRALDANKDQSYVLAMLRQDQLAHLAFPLGQFTKREVRRIAEDANLPTAQKRESQDICFVPDGDYVHLLEQRTGQPLVPGPIEDLEGTHLGTHRGAAAYTIGQRKGLGVAAGQPLYVCKKDMARNTVYAGPRSALLSRSLIARDVNLIAPHLLEDGAGLTARTQYRQPDAPVTAKLTEDGRLHVTFAEPQYAIAAGQAVVLYHGDIVVAGATVDKVAEP